MSQSNIPFLCTSKNVSKACPTSPAHHTTCNTESVFMACGMRDPVLGPPVIERMAKTWKNGCYYAEINEAEHCRSRERGWRSWRLRCLSGVETSRGVGRLGRPELLCR